jgi:hypothetical protein
MSYYPCVRFLLSVSILSSLLAVHASAQTANAPRRITQPIDDKNLTVLKGNTHPMARQQFDRGAAPSGLAMDRMLLVLKHTDAQEKAVKDLIAGQQVQGSPQFHKWLTPQQFGEMFGPSDADLQTVTSWLESRGLQLNSVSNSKHFIEFSGTAAQVQSAFHTSIHRFNVNGKDHWANSTDPQIPAALASVVAGVKTLHNFTPKPALHRAGTFRRDAGTGRTQKIDAEPQFTFPTNCFADCNYGIGPTDFATIYNVSPLWQAGIDGTGQSIAIVQVSNIDIQDVRNFRKVFDLPPNDPEIILNGPDPGLVDAEDEAAADVEWSGAVAKGAKIKLVVSSDTNTTAGTDLSALYIVDNNIAPILSESFGECELFLGTTENQFLNSLWQQAAAEGITVFVASGDSGSAGCDNPNTETAATRGLAVNGIASTPYDVAVGGTDFLAGPLGAFQFFSFTNDPKTQASALSYIPEIPWTDGCGFPLLGLDPGNCDSLGFNLIDIIATGGGVSACTVSNGQDVSTCTGGYPKPSWQTGVGVPADGKRDVPDVSLFAGNGFLQVFYIYCQADALPSNPSCALDPGSTTDFLGAGGTSFSAPNFAGIMALVNQKTQARQGNANFVLYKLAAGQDPTSCSSLGQSLPAATCTFNDIQFGDNFVPCVPGTPNCVTNGLPIGGTSGYLATPGYDPASGLGSVNAANLVNNWKSITFTPTKTSLKLSPSVITHGQPVGIDIAVAAKSGTPTGQVALETNHKDPAGDFTLDPTGKIDTTTRLLPGGLSSVTARYGGDPLFSSSVSSSDTVFVLPEPSTTKLSLFTLTLKTGATPPFAGGSYGSIVFVRADVAGRSGLGFASGKVNITDNNKPLPGNLFSLNSAGYTLTPNSTNTFAIGSHTLRAEFLGDPSFIPSVAKALTFVITKAPTTASAAVKPTVTVRNASVAISAAIATNSFGDQPTGTVTFLAADKSIGKLTLQGATDPATGQVSGTATLDTSKLPVGTIPITAVYSGDHNYNGSTSTAATLTIENN